LQASTTNNQTYLTSNAFLGTTDWIYQFSDAATQYRQFAGQHNWFIAPSGTAGNAISFTQAMTLSNDGTNASTLEVSTQNVINATARLRINSPYYNFWDIINDSNLRFSRGGSEWMRIDNSGNLLVGKTTASDSTAGSRLAPSGLGVFTRSNGDPIATVRLDTNGDIVTFYRGTSGGSLTQVGSVSVTTTATAYNTSSDYRLKNTIAPMANALAKVALLKPCTYKWNADGSDGEGFIAHELAEVVPQCVTGEKDAVDEEGNPKYQGIDTSFLVATLTAAIQEQQALIQTLTARVTALEGTQP
jgi:hypothetical protein